MEQATVEDVSMFLREHGIPEQILATFAGKYIAIICTMFMFYNV